MEVTLDRVCLPQKDREGKGKKRARRGKEKWKEEEKISTCM